MSNETVEKYTPAIHEIAKEIQDVLKEIKADPKVNYITVPYEDGSKVFFVPDEEQANLILAILKVVYLPGKTAAEKKDKFI